MSLLEEAKKGDKIAYKDLIVELRIKLYKTARLYFKQEPEVLKAVSYTLKKLYKDIKNVKDEYSLTLYAINILKNYCEQKIIEYSNNRKWKKKYNTEEYEIAYQKYRQESRLEQFVTSISPERRLIAVLYYYDELEVSDIAKLTKMPEDKVEEILDLVRKDLIELVINEGVKAYNEYV